MARWVIQDTTLLNSCLQQVRLVDEKLIIIIYSIIENRCNFNGILSYTKLHAVIDSNEVLIIAVVAYATYFLLILQSAKISNLWKFWIKISDPNFGSKFWIKILNQNFGSQFWIKIWDLNLRSKFRIEKFGIKLCSPSYRMICHTEWYVVRAVYIVATMSQLSIKCTSVHKG